MRRRHDMSRPTIIFDRVHKKFSRGLASDSLRDAFAAPIRKLLGRGEAAPGTAGNGEFWALNDVSFEVQPGEALGVIGPNGSGKSTTLKLLARILRPDKGRVAVSGRVGALIELGAGFHPDLTGRENVFLNASILGMGKEEIRRKYDQIVAFAELEDFMDMPVKWYSSGMYARLGFAVAAHVDPEVLLVDEVLSVGDFAFRDKCIEKMREFAKSNVTMVVVSHDRLMVEKLCGKGILLRKGKMESAGPVREVLDRYYTSLSGPGGAEFSSEASKKNMPIQITGVKVLDSGKGELKSDFLTSEGMTLQIFYRANEKISSPCFFSYIVSPTLSASYGAAIVHGSTSERFKLDIECAPGDEGMVEVRYKALNLLGGKYHVTVGVKANHFSTGEYDKVEKAVTLTISSALEQGGGTVFIEHNWSIMKKNLQQDQRPEIHQFQQSNNAKITI